MMNVNNRSRKKKKLIIICQMILGGNLQNDLGEKNKIRQMVLSGEENMKFVKWSGWVGGWGESQNSLNALGKKLQNSSNSFQGGGSRN